MISHDILFLFFFFFIRLRVLFPSISKWNNNIVFYSYMIIIILSIKIYLFQYYRQYNTGQPCPYEWDDAAAICFHNLYVMCIV